MSKYEYIGVNDQLLDGKRIKQNDIIDLDDQSVDLILFRKIKEKKDDKKGGNK